MENGDDVGRRRQLEILFVCDERVVLITRSTTARRRCLSLSLLVLIERWARDFLPSHPRELRGLK